MLIPKLFYGKTATVKRECRKLATKIRKGGTFDEVYGNLEVIETTETEGHIVFGGPNPLVGDRPHFHVYIWPWMISESYYKKNQSTPIEFLKEGFLFALKYSWSFLAIHCSTNGRWYDEKQLEMWSSMVKFYNIYEEEGRRFSTGSNLPARYWEISTTAAWIMLKMGVPEKEFRPPLGEELIPYTYPPFWHLVKKYKLPTE